MIRDETTAAGRLKRLLDPLGPDDWGTSSPNAPLAPYGQHSDPAAALTNFRADLRSVFKALESLVGLQ